MNFEPQPSIGNRVVEFLRRGGMWTIMAGRTKAREACTEFLMRVSEDVREFIIDKRGIVLLAPSEECPGMSLPYTGHTPGGATMSLAVIYLNHRLEKIRAVNTLVVVATCVANALQARSDARDEIRSVTPDVLLNSWGFGGEIAATRRREKGLFNGLDITEFLN